MAPWTWIEWAMWWAAMGMGYVGGRDLLAAADLDREFVWANRAISAVLWPLEIALYVLAFVILIAMVVADWIANRKHSFTARLMDASS
jgi:hypothetical protein